MLRPGTTIGKYEINEPIGEGGMGTVYRAFDAALQRTVAIKLVTDRFARISEFLEQLANEARQAAAIDSEYVVRIWEFDNSGETPFIAFEYVPGTTLSSCLSDLSQDDKIRISRQLALGLKAAHSLGVLHRDLKPDNVRLTPEGQVKILDFGLARSVSADSVDDRGQVKGTLHYMSPEQISGGEITPASDLFSYGVLLYELYTGFRPFEGDYPAAVIYSILHEEPVPPCERDADLPEWVNALVLRLLHKDPAQRFGDISEVIAFLEDAERKGVAAVYPGMYETRRKTVTVTRLKNLSDDSSWDYFCSGFTEDVLRELARRTDLIVSHEPESPGHVGVREVFDRCRSDYVVTGSMMKHEDLLRLDLSIYGDEGENLVFGKHYRGQSQQLFELLSRAAEEAASALSDESGSQAIGVDDFEVADVSAYDFYLKGRSYYPSNKPEELNYAADMFKKALELDPTLAVAHAGLSDVYATQYMAYYDHSPERIKAAGDEAEAALEINSRSPDAHRAKGRYFMFTGLFEKAEEAFLTSIEIEPRYAIGYRTLAWLKAAQGDLEQALRWARSSHRLAPTDLETLLLLSLIYIYQFKYTLAMSTLQRAIELGPDYGRAYFNLGTVYMKLGVLDLALENFLKAIEFKGDPNAYIEAAYVHMLLGQFAEAEKKFRQSIEADLLVFVAEYYLGLLRHIQGDGSEARRRFELAIEASERLEAEDPDNADILSFKSLALVALGRKDEASAIVSRLLESHAEHGIVLHNVARYYTWLGEWEQVGKFLQKSEGTVGGYTRVEIDHDPHFRELPR